MTTKQKILYLITLPEHGGAQVYVNQLAQNLSADYEIVIASSGNDNDWLPSQLKKSEIKWIKLKNVQRKINLLSDLHAFFEIRELIKKEKPDIIHLNSSKISILGTWASLGINVKVVYTVHGWVWLEPLPTWLKTFYKTAEKYTAMMKDKIICVSEYDKKAGSKNGIDAKKMITIHNGIDTKQISFLTEAEAKTKLANNYNLNPLPAGQAGNNYLVGTIANLYQTKNISALIKSANMLLREHPDWQFVVIGSGPEKNALKKIIAEGRLENNFYLLGSINNASELLPAFDLFVLPSVKEGLPYTILEAMTAGLPIVASRVGGIPEILDKYPEKQYQLIDPHTPDELTTAIENMQNKPNLSSEELNIVRQQIDISKMIDKVKQVYSEL